MATEAWPIDASLKTKQSPWWLVLMGGVLSIIVGALLLTSPVKTVTSLAIALGIWWIVGGILSIVGMFFDHSAWFWKLIVGILGIVAGFLILRNPIAGAVALPSVILLLLGIQGLIGGILLLIMGFTGGGLGTIIMGALSTGLGAVLLLNWTNPAMIVSLVWVAGIFLIVGGAIQCVKAFIR
jgi:uncharacterized membrane protein HdeD (DUF308 family)